MNLHIIKTFAKAKMTFCVVLYLVKVKSYFTDHENTEVETGDLVDVKEEKSIYVSKRGRPPKNSALRLQPRRPSTKRKISRPARFQDQV